MVLYHGLASPYGDLRIKVQGEANPKARLTEDFLSFGPGGASAEDVYLKRSAGNTLELKSQYLLPQTDNFLELGSPTGPKKIAKIYASSFLLPTDGFLHITVYVIVTKDGKIILRISVSTKSRPEYIMLG